MAKNIERAFSRLQSLCEEKLQGCEKDFNAHAAWLHGTFKANALRQLKNQKVELACPTSAKNAYGGTAVRAQAYAAISLNGCDSKFYVSARMCRGG